MTTDQQLVSQLESDLDAAGVDQAEWDACFPPIRRWWANWQDDMTGGIATDEEVAVSNVGTPLRFCFDSADEEAEYWTLQREAMDAARYEDYIPTAEEMDATFTAEQLPVVGNDDDVPY